MDNILPYNECQTCTGLECCPAVEVADDGYGSPAPPNNCPKGMDVVKERNKKVKRVRNQD